MEGRFNTCIYLKLDQNDKLILFKNLQTKILELKNKILTKEKQIKLGYDQLIPIEKLHISFVSNIGLSYYQKIIITKELKEILKNKLEGLLISDLTNFIFLKDKSTRFLCFEVLDINNWWKEIYDDLKLYLLNNGFSKNLFFDSPICHISIFKTEKILKKKPIQIILKRSVEDLFMCKNIKNVKISFDKIILKIGNEENYINLIKQY